MSKQPTVTIEPRIDSETAFYGFAYVTSDGSSGPDTRMVFIDEGSELAIYRAQGWSNPSRRQISAVTEALRPEAERRGLAV